MERNIGGGNGGKREKKERSGSIANIEEIWKRKREILERSGEGEEDIFKKSKIVR